MQMLCKHTCGFYISDTEHVLWEIHGGAGNSHGFCSDVIESCGGLGTNLQNWRGEVTLPHQVRSWSRTLRTASLCSFPISSGLLTMAVCLTRSTDICSSKSPHVVDTEQQIRSELCASFCSRGQIRHQFPDTYSISPWEQ